MFPARNELGDASYSRVRFHSIELGETAHRPFNHPWSHVKHHKALTARSLIDPPSQRAATLCLRFVCQTGMQDAFAGNDDPLPIPVHIQGLALGWLLPR